MPSWQPAIAGLRAKIMAKASEMDAASLGQGKETPASLRAVVVEMIRSGEATQTQAAEAIGCWPRTIRRWPEWTCPPDFGNSM